VVGKLGTRCVDDSKGLESMIQILALILVGIALFFIFLRIALQGPSYSAPDSSAVVALRQMVNLDGLSFAAGMRLLDSSEFDMLSGTPELHEVAAAYRKERQALALVWISLLRNDVNDLWRFRRFLVRNGVPATMGEEMHILSDAVRATLFLGFLRVVITTFGPFAFSGAARNAHRMVEQMSEASARVLDRMPRHGWPEIERAWQKSAAA
jgi:hypothetical protein